MTAVEEEEEMLIKGQKPRKKSRLDNSYKCIQTEVQEVASREAEVDPDKTKVEEVNTDIRKVYGGSNDDQDWPDTDFMVEVAVRQDWEERQEEIARSRRSF